MAGMVDFSEVLEVETGREVDPVQWQLGRAAFALLRRQTEEIADKLAAVGHDMRVPLSDADPALWKIGDLTGGVEKSSGAIWRRCQILPEVAKRDRGPALKQIELFLEDHPKGGFARYWVATRGQRIGWFDPSGRDQVKAFHRRLSRLASMLWHDFSIEVVCRSTEMPADVVGLHVHANLVLIPYRFLGEDAWDKVLTAARSVLGGAWLKDAGRIDDIREVLKYVTKPSVGPEAKRDGEMGLCDLTPEQLGWMFETVHGLKLFQPFQRFRQWRSELQESGEKVHRLRGRQLVRVTKPRRLHKQQKASQKGGQAENIILARTMPHPAFAPVFEPCTIVMNYTPTPKTGVGRIGLAILRERQAEAAAWQAARARASYIVHTCASTVQAHGGQSGPPVGAAGPPVAVPAGP